jgi:acyl-CoA reductase-like NAD-dependent aldehyde dehydrogenase
VNALTRNSGQSCLALTRFIVHRSLLDEYVDRIGAAVRGLTVGPGIEDPSMGPLISEDQLTKVLARVEGGVADGAVVEVGGTRLTEGPLDAGYFMAPTVLTSVEPSMAVAQEEIFGPVQCVLAFDSEDEAVELANDSTYGLAAAVFGSDFGTLSRVVARIDAGQVLINESPLGGVETPFGGYKHSGIGREKGVEAIRHYTQSKTVVARIGPRPS